MIEAFIRSGRVTRLPCAAAAETMARIPEQDRAALAAYRASLPASKADWKAYNAGVAQQVRAARNAAALRRSADAEVSALPRRKIGPPAPLRPVTATPAPLPEPKVKPMDDFSSFPPRPRPVLFSSPPAAMPRPTPALAITGVHPTPGQLLREQIAADQRDQREIAAPPAVAFIADSVAFSRPAVAFEAEPVDIKLNEPAVVEGPEGVGIADITWDADRGAFRFLLTDGTARLVAVPIPTAPAPVSASVHKLELVAPAPKPSRPARPKPVKGSWTR